MALHLLVTELSLSGKYLRVKIVAGRLRSYFDPVRELAALLGVVSCSCEENEPPGAVGGV